jgi:hypothetical protein
MSASSKAQPKPKPPANSAKKGEEHATVPVRVSPTVHQFIIAKANWGESIDRTLRRLLHIPEGAQTGVAGR